MKRYILIILLIYLSHIARAQRNLIYYASPYSHVDINSKTAGMGEIGVVTTGKTYFAGPYQNPSLLTNSDKSADIIVSYIPNIITFFKGDFGSNIMLFYKWNEKNVIGGEFTYYSMGEIDTLQPYEYYAELNYAHRFNDNLSAGTILKYIYIDLCGNSDCSEVYRPGRTFAVDLGLDFENELDLSEKLTLSYDLGASLNNLGPRISYTDGRDKFFLPAKLIIGLMGSIPIRLNEKIDFILSAAYQAEKLLVPTPPEYYADSLDAEGEKVIKSGRKPPSSLPLSWIQSFYDAPGGFKEEWHEILHKFGVEVCIKYPTNFKLALRCGRLCQHWTKGYKSYNTLGAGLYICGFTLDVRLYLSNSVIYNTYGFTAGLQLDL